MSSSGRVRRAIHLILPIGAVAATLTAALLVVTLIWWARSLSAPVAPPPVARLPLVQAPPAARVSAPSQPPAGEAQPAAPPPAAAKAARAVPAPNTAPPPAAPPLAEARSLRQLNPDAAKNLAIGQGLSRVANDPEMQRRLGATEP